MANVVSDLEPVSGTVNNGSDVRNCFGQKLCPNGMSNLRWQFSCSMNCRDEFIQRKLKAGWSPMRIMPEVKEMWPTYSNSLILSVIGKIAEKNRYHFGWKTVEHAIRLGGLYEAPYSEEDITWVRESFGVYGREGYRRASDVPVELPEGEKIDEAKLCEEEQ